MNDDFHTLKGYDMIEKKQITPAMEDYLEMVFRLCQKKEYTRISEISQYLNVKPSSATKMISNLKLYDLVTFEKYGLIRLTEKGINMGKYLIYRHNTLNTLLCLINHSESELETVEKIEHFINEKTIRNMDKFIDYVKNL